LSPRDGWTASSAAPPTPGRASAWSGPSPTRLLTPQQIEVDYPSLEGLEDFAARRRREFAGKALEFPRLSGFCLLACREALERAGGFDERFGLGFFDDDDLCLRVRNPGFRTLVALDVFVHHFGSRTFTALGVDFRKHLKENFERFKEKWGPEHAAPYRLPEEGMAAAGETPAPQVPAAAAGETPAPQVPAVAAAAGQQGVSMCMMVKNEEAILGDCLKSVADLVDQVVVVDTGSTDRTKEIAASFGPKVKIVDFPWRDDFAAARNESLRHASGAWIFWMDADDLLDEDNRGKFRTLLANLPEGNAAFAMKCLCLPNAPGDAGTVVDHVRLFRNHPRLRWQYRVHEQILPALRQMGARVRWSDVVIHHSGYQDPALRRRKLERDLRLLRLEEGERPDDPFTLFNLGQVFQELGQYAEALPLLRRSLARSHPSDSIVRKIYALIVGCHRRLGQQGKALAACAEGRLHYPADDELLFLEGVIRRDRGDLAGAAAALERLLASPPAEHFASVDAGLRGPKARHNLAVVYQQQGRSAEAEALWRQVVAEQPAFLPAWLGLGELHLGRKGWEEVEAAAARLEAAVGGATEAAVLRARGELARGEYNAARTRLESAIAVAPQAVWPRVILSHVLLQEGKDAAAAEQALRDVLALDPNNAEARHNLQVHLAGRQPAA
jgi:GT2 family glycosyltransferase/tetratricopeptide (TPR) repeat protein